MSYWRRNENKMQNRQGSFSARLWLSVSVSLMVLVLALTACSLGNTTTSTPDTHIPSATPVITASIQGVVWHDLCVNFSDEENPPQGCVDEDSMDIFTANGILEAGEVGIPEVLVELGAGPCPSDSIASDKTDEKGKFIFENLWPGEYCVFPSFDVSPLPASIVPGVWTFPKSADGSIRGMVTLTLLPGEHRKDMNFGWDYLNQPIPPTPEPTPEPTPTPRCVDAASFIKDVTIPDGTRIGLGDSFRKVWRIRNFGTCTWTSEYDLVFLSGYSMDAYTVVSMRGEIAPGQVMDLSVGMKAPNTIGTYWGYWMLRNEQGGIFGVGEDADTPLWVKILVEPDITDWRGEYFDNRKLKGDPVLIRNDEEIDFDWKKEAPAASLPTDDFSVRWSRRLRFDDAFYRFSFLVDDGVRLWVDDRMVLDEWETGAAREISVTLQMTEGNHDIKIEFFERGGQARIYLDIDRISTPNTANWIGTYWFNRTMDSKWALVKTIDRIDFDWGLSTPTLGIPSDDFSIRWDQTLDFETGMYRFHAFADDGIRVEVDGEPIIDEWHTSNASETYTADVLLSGQHEIRVEYFERGGHAKVSLWWEFLGPPNQPPVGNADEFGTMANEVLIVPAPGVLSNDEDPDGDVLIGILVSGTSSGSMELDEDGSFVYRPNSDYVGEDEFTYRISDGELLSSDVLVTLTVLPSNHPPIANDDAFGGIEEELIDVPAPGLLENDVDDDSQSLTAYLETEPSQGSIDLREDGSFLYTPGQDFTGVDQFTYRASDGQAMSNIATVTITITPQNNPPIAMNDVYEVEEDGVLTVIAPGILVNDVDPDGQPLQIVLEQEPDFGSLVLHEDGSFEYTPLADFDGDDVFSYWLSDGEARSELAIVQIQVLPLNDLPQAFDDQVNGTLDQILEIDVLSNDLGLGDGPITIMIESPPINGTLEVIEGIILYSPNAGFLGEDEFSYSITDQDGEYAQAIVNILLNPLEG